MVDLLDLQKSFILAHLKPGDTAVDYTMGNGHDTAFLSETVGESGKVFARSSERRQERSATRR